MTTSLLSIAAQHYAVGVYNFNITISAGTSALNISMTRQNWPDGIALNSVAVSDPTGALVASANGIPGGALTNPISGAAVNTQDMQISASDGQTLPAGVYTVTMNVAQPLTTSTSITSTP